MKEIKPVLLNEKLIIELAKAIRNYMKDIVYSPLVMIYKNEYNSNVKLNSIDTLKTAINSGRISIDSRGYVKGKLSAVISKEIEKLGGKYVNGRYRFKKIPQELEYTIKQLQIKKETVARQFDEYLKDMESNLKNGYIRDDDPYINEIFDNIFDEFESQIVGNFRKYMIVPKYNTEIKNQLMDNYINRIDLGIKNMLQNTITNLRKEILEEIRNKGTAPQYLADILQNNYGFTQNKAVFIARNETSLVLANYSKARYNDLKIKKFKWQSAGDIKVRHLHRELNNKIFSFDNPPIIDENTGFRGLPGETYNCRCVMVPIIE